VDVSGTKRPVSVQSRGMLKCIPPGVCTGYPQLLKGRS
jgi:hypothetical protein